MLGVCNHYCDRLDFPGDEGTSCTTVGGAKPDQPCVFPFTNNGVTYNGCTTDNDPDGRNWCSVATDDAGVHLKGSWGHCPQEGCPLDQEQEEEECTLHTGEVGACTPLALCAGFFPTQEDVDACSTPGEPCSPVQGNILPLSITLCYPRFSYFSLNQIYPLSLKHF